MTALEEARAREKCRECRAGFRQAQQVEPGWRCMDHGVVRLSEHVAALAALPVPGEEDRDA